MFNDLDTVRTLVSSGFRGLPILVVGDVMLDCYLWGEVERVSPEAPVPVVRLTRETERCGGAANVAANLAGLGLRPSIAGWVGQDREGRALTDLLKTAKVGIQDLLPRENVPTIAKVRIIGGHQQMLRMDREAKTPPPPAFHQTLLERITQRLSEPDPPAAIILSDYGKGTLSESVCQGLIQAARRQGIPILVDPKGTQYHKYRHATALSPNRDELAAALGQPNTGPLEALLSDGDALRRDLELDFLTVTLSEQGIALVDDQGIHRIPARAQEVFDVSGAGDTVIATLTAALAVGMKRMEAIHLANLAAGVVVGKVGTTPISRPELEAALSNERALDQSSKIQTLENALALIESWRLRRERIVFTNGCFDLLHVGHVTYLEQARRLGHRLVVGLNTDQSVHRLKGPSRPIIQESDRARVLAAMASVDLVILFDEDTPMRLIQTIQPNVLAKGADYREEEVVGAREVKAWGGEVALVSLIQGQSSSRIMDDIQQRQCLGREPTPSLP
jgi:D-beta-D-heptose 7-phosphate kinase/D-beta-D-heptose 1-phosphate adenosyltransferase